MTRSERRELIKGMLALIALIVLLGMIGSNKPKFVVNDIHQKRMEKSCKYRHTVERQDSYVMQMLLK